MFKVQVKTQNLNNYYSVERTEARWHKKKQFLQMQLEM